MFCLPLKLRAVFLACKPFFVLQLRVIGTGKQAAQDTLFLLWLVIKCVWRGKGIKYGDSKPFPWPALSVASTPSKLPA